MHDVKFQIQSRESHWKRRFGLLIQYSRIGPSFTTGTSIDCEATDLLVSTPASSSPSSVLECYTVPEYVKEPDVGIGSLEAPKARRSKKNVYNHHLPLWQGR